MAVTVDTQESAKQLAPVLPGPTPRLPVPASTVQAQRRVGLQHAIRQALDQRRLFLLFPFAVIAGLVAYLATPVLPDLMTVGAVGSALIGAMFAFRNNLIGLRLSALATSFWFGFALLAVHGAAFGTTMLARPLYGQYEMRVDEILREVESGTRIIVSDITPGPDARSASMRRARIIEIGRAHV